MLQRLYKYISGDNVDNKKISMTTPVITFVKPEDDFKHAEQNYTVAFYLPAQFQVWHAYQSHVCQCDDNMLIVWRPTHNLAGGGNSSLKLIESDTWLES